MNLVRTRVDEIAYSDGWEAFAPWGKVRLFPAQQAAYISFQAAIDNTFLFDRQVGEAFERAVQ